MGISRLIVIACELGYVCDEGGRLGWTLVCDRQRGFNCRIRQHESVHGRMVKQEGDTEAAGTAPYGVIDDVLRVLEPYRRQPPRPGASAEQMRKIRPKSKKHGSRTSSGT